MLLFKNIENNREWVRQSSFRYLRENLSAGIGKTPQRVIAVPRNEDERTRKAELKQHFPITRCPVCGGDRFHEQAVLWPELIAEWN
jgi:hypothetical protein